MILWYVICTIIKSIFYYSIQLFMNFINLLVLIIFFTDYKSFNFQ